MTDAEQGTPAPTPKPRRRRGAAESLASIVLACEAFVVLLAGLVIYGLDAMPGDIAPWWGLVAGGALALAMIVTGRFVRYTWGIALGWVLQVVLALGAFLEPTLLLISLIFGSMYAYATIKGKALDERNARLSADQPDQA
jgi:hypothetical protein